MLSYKHLHHCPLDLVVQVWNEGFEGYFLDVTMTVDRFVTRLVLEELSPTLSFIAYKNETPVGIVLNGVRWIDGKKIAWNGGTAVIKAQRGTGIGKELISHALQIYAEERVHTATLEAISENAPAIHVYKGKGYSIEDDIFYMENDSRIGIDVEAWNRYDYNWGSPHDIKEMSGMPYPWQLHWSIYRRDGESLVMRENDRPIAYVLFRKVYDQIGNNVGVTVAQCELLGEREDGEKLLHILLSKILRPELPSYKRMVPVMGRNRALRSVLHELGFKQRFSQVYMKNELLRS
jgi:GNAT superfamily N-acetyltransferase